MVRESMGPDLGLVILEKEMWVEEELENVS